MRTKNLLIVLITCIMSLCAYANTQNFHPYCSNGDGVSYVQGRTESFNGSSKIILNGYGVYRNATVLVIVYTRGSDGEDHEWYRTTATIVNGEGKTGLNLSDVSKIEIKVADYCK